MNKRSAMMTAAGLVLALVVSGVALTMGITGPTAAAKKVPVAAKSKQAPIVHTITHTVTVHKKADAPSTSASSGGSAPVIVRTLPAPAPAATAPIQTTTGGEGEYEGSDSGSEDGGAIVATDGGGQDD